MKQFYIVNPDKLTDYGFYHDCESGRYWWRLDRHRAKAMWVYDDDLRLTIQSPSRDAITVLCEMFRDGVLNIYDDNVEYPLTMKVTATEMREIFKQRKERNK